MPAGSAVSCGRLRPRACLVQSQPSTGIGHSSATMASGTPLGSLRLGSVLSGAATSALQVAPVLVIDFDDTLTRGDTVGVLIDAAISAQARNSDAPDERRAGLRALKESLVQGYVEAFQGVISRHLPEGALARAQGLDMEVASGFLDDMNDFEARMNTRVVESGILAGIQEADIEAAAAHVELRPHSREAIRTALQRGWPVHVLSVNWSAALIRATLAGIPCRIVTEADALDAADEEHSGYAFVHANSLEMHLGISTGSILCQVQGPMDKGNVFEDILLSRAAASGDGSVPSVYVGDSIGDLAALLAAHVPIVLGSNAMLRHALSVFGCVLHPIGQANLEGGSHPAGHLYTADTWQEIVEALFAGPPRTPSRNGSGEAPSAGISAAAASPATPSPDCHAASLAAVGPLRSVRTRAGPAAVDAGAQAQDGAACVDPPRVLVVAGSDSGGGAGIQADIKACMACGAFASTAITALTAQNSSGVHAVHTPPVHSLRAQLDAVATDLSGARRVVVKTGMLPDREAVEAVAEAVERLRRTDATVQLVADPVLISTSGHSLADSEVCGALRERLLPLATLVTPNVPEASALLDERKIDSLQDMRAAAQELQQRCGAAVLLKGGHMQRGGGEALVDVLCTRDGAVHELCTAAVHTRNTHGTGCALASACAAFLARGASVPQAARLAQRYVASVITSSVPLSIGEGPQGAMDHGAGLCAQPRLPSGPEVYRLYAVTDPACNTGSGRTMAEAVAGAVAGGATIVQIREKDADGGAFLETVTEALAAAAAAGVPVIVNDRVDVALAARAHGVHIGQDDMPCAAVRRLVGPSMIVGVSVKSPEEAVAAARDGADYVGVGAVFATATKQSEAIGVEAIARIVAASPVPVVAIGGIKADNAAEVMRSGCAGVAVVSALFAAQDVAAATRELHGIVSGPGERPAEGNETGDGAVAKTEPAAAYGS